MALVVTSSRTSANAKQKTNGPAKSVSSMIFASIRDKECQRTKFTSRRTRISSGTEVLTNPYAFVSAFTKISHIPTVLPCPLSSQDFSVITALPGIEISRLDDWTHPRSRMIVAYGKSGIEKGLVAN